ncbi:MAG: DNA polymerase subunit beta [Chloroflexi bacterium]|nr:DNA polymerase subunit beta [Chloroflexota bacterium]
MNELTSLLISDYIKFFCKRWKIQELALFGSALRIDFGMDSDVDLLVSFEKTADWSLLEHVQMQFELEEILERKVDLVNKRALKRSQNWIRREEILRTASPIFTKKEVVHGTGWFLSFGYCTLGTSVGKIHPRHD